MRALTETRRPRHRTKAASVLLIYAMLFAPILGCSDTATDSPPPGTSTASAAAGAAQPAPSLTESTLQNLGDAWHFITDTTESGLTIASERCEVGAQMVLDATRTAWIWSTDTTADGWGWIIENAGDATEWASDTANRAWTVTERKGGEFSLWVRVKATDGVAWARTTLPATWKLTKDAAGEAWVWIDEHKVEVAVAAAVVTVVVAGLLVAPEGVAPAIVRGAVAGTAAETTKFLVAVWNGRNDTDQRQALQTVSHDMFMSIGKSVLSQCGAQVLGSLPTESA